MPSAKADPLFNRPNRRDVDMRGFVVRCDGSIEDVRILDLSYDGCAIESTVDFSLGEELKLSVLGRGAIHATVRWNRGHTVGLLFGRDQDVADQQPRRGERMAMAAEVLLRRTSNLGYRVKLFDASAYGCKCEFIDRPRIKEQLWVKFDGLEALEAMVCWVESSSIGLEYVRPMHPAVFDMLAHRLGSEPR